MRKQKPDPVVDLRDSIILDASRPNDNEDYVPVAAGRVLFTKIFLRNM